MPALIQKWITEHRNFERLLKVLEEQLELFRRGEQPDYGLMLDIVYYMTQYPDRFHHPHEDAAFAQMADAKVNALIAQSREQHRVIAESGKTLMERLEAVAGSVAPLKAEIEQLARTYIEYLRRNMQQEEVKLFPLAQRVLTEDDWSVISALAPKVSDPLFGGRDQERYRILQRLIASQVHCECVIA